MNVTGKFSINDDEFKLTTNDGIITLTNDDEITNFIREVVCTPILKRKELKRNLQEFFDNISNYIYNSLKTVVELKQSVNDLSKQLDPTIKDTIRLNYSVIKNGVRITSADDKAEYVTVNRLHTIYKDYKANGQDISGAIALFDDIESIISESSLYDKFTTIYGVNESLNSRLLTICDDSSGYITIDSYKDEINSLLSTLRLLLDEIRFYIRNIISIIN